MLMTFLERIFENTGGIVCNFFAQYYLPPCTKNTLDMHGHFGFHQDGFAGYHYRLLITVGDSNAGKKMTFSICDKKPSDKNPGDRVTLSSPHGRAVLLNRYCTTFL